jgi:hypothetical protein
MGSGGTASTFFTSKTDGGGWSDSCLCRFTMETAADTHCIGGWVGPRAGLDGTGKKQFPSSCRGSNPDSSAVKPVAQLLYQLSYRASPPKTDVWKMHVLQQTSSCNFQSTLSSCRYSSNSSILALLATLHAKP